jgi:hypothetical protein
MTIRAAVEFDYLECDGRVRAVIQKNVICKNPRTHVLPRARMFACAVRKQIRAGPSLLISDSAMGCGDCKCAGRSAQQVQLLS